MMYTSRTVQRGIHWTHLNRSSRRNTEVVRLHWMEERSEGKSLRFVNLVVSGRKSVVVL